MSKVERQTVPGKGAPKASPRSSVPFHTPPVSNEKSLTSTTDLRAKRLEDLRATDPAKKSTAEGRKVLSDQTNIADDLLRPLSRGEKLKESKRPKPQEQKPVSSTAGEKQSGLGGLGSLANGSPPPLPPRVEVDWENLKPGDRVPAVDEGGAEWVAVEYQGRVRLERAGPEGTDGHGDWTEVYGEGAFIPVQERERPSEDGGPAWVEARWGEQGHTSVLRRTRPDPNGGPDWNESKTGDSITSSRQVPDSNGGPDWTEYLNSETGKITRTRTVPDPEGGQPWQVRVDENGQEIRWRRYRDEDGVVWDEAISGTNHWRVNANARSDAMEKGPHEVLRMAGPGGQDIEVNVYGATEEELDRIKRRLEALPPAMRIHTGDIVLAEDIGQMKGPDDTWVDNVAGLGGPDGITLNRSSVGSDGQMDHVLYHEMGHVQDYRTGDPSKGSPWGNGQAVSCYGNTNPREDYAEAHRIALTNADQFKGMTREAILNSSPFGSRIVEILDSYGFEYGTGTGTPSLGMLGCGPQPLPPSGDGGGIFGTSILELMLKNAKIHQEGVGP